METALKVEHSLQAHAKLIASQRMQDWFTQHPSREREFSLSTCGITLDYSHNLLTQDTLALLARHCDQVGLRQHLQDLMSGKPVNTTENRSALHTALRDPNPRQDIRQAREHCETLVNSLSDRAFTDVVHLGVGGSYWGPLCVHQALSHLPARTRVHFVATIDPAELASVLAPLNPDTTLFILASKSFGTQEMLANAERAKSWLARAGIHSVADHFVAVTENQAAALAWGLPAVHILPVWSWVGGRFSVWSMMGLPIILAYGFEAFDALLAGAYAMDLHTLNEPWLKNMPTLLALIDYWYRQIFHLNTLAIIPYEYGLRGLIPHLQQLHMESLGKPGNGPTGGIVWGALGSNAQHTFNQLLHQGTEIVPIDFILSRQGCKQTPALERHCRAQRQALMTGHQAENPHAILQGNRPSNLLLLDALSPENLGSLLALYEHKVTILAALYGINAFDQFGVEYSKQLAL
jgi:glucose-6-phosphate isomerase